MGVVWRIWLTCWSHWSVGGINALRCTNTGLLHDVEFSLCPSLPFQRSCCVQPSTQHANGIWRPFLLSWAALKGTCIDSKSDKPLYKILCQSFWIGLKQPLVSLTDRRGEALCCNGACLDNLWVSRAEIFSCRSFEIGQDSSSEDDCYGEICGTGLF